jgi:gastric triacylglycerol lipase
VEEHKATTSDGYVLTLYRIPGPQGSTSHTPGKKAVFLQHGLLDSSFTWVSNLPHQSLGFVLADAGYDVWLGNVRGNTYSKQHNYYDTDDNDFWDFTLDEMGYKDVPAMINYVLAATGQSSLSYVGHSQGGMVGLIAFGLYPDLAAKINVFVALAPATNIANAKGGFNLLAPFDDMINLFFQMFFDGEFLPSTGFIEWAAKHICPEENWLSAICTSTIFLFAGYDPLHINETRLPVYISKTPAGTSSRNMVHFSQILKEERWARYDYGRWDNQDEYGSKTPPEYDISKMTVPTAVFYSAADWLVTKKDVEGYLLPRVKNLILAKDYKDYQHLDFTWGKDAYLTLYKEVQELLATYSQ